MYLNTERVKLPVTPLRVSLTEIRQLPTLTTWTCVYEDFNSETVIHGISLQLERKGERKDLSFFFGNNYTMYYKAQYYLFASSVRKL